MTSNAMEKSVCNGISCFISNFGDSGEIHAHTKMGFCEEGRHKEGRRKLETTDKARDFDLSRPSDFEV